MTKLSKSNVIAFPLTPARNARLLTRIIAKPILRAHWRVSSATGQLECLWKDGGDPPASYSFAA